ncbi:DUF1120 domain-containing protein [Burkholderia aenigmatica]|uniref:DUF1120 domain-containing protein n=1 Tax=Burkholderia aenigmatica TaxID=2015348 RepID=A0A228HTL4_9BURK|nr:DUF1120 domain-containing protein [Burkholderia aenigmatica]OXI33506.1 hypothetical protein CFB84_37870 [Burkholderia aenigmatica]
MLVRVLPRYALVHIIPHESEIQMIQMISKKLCVLSALACALSIPGVTVAADVSVGGQIRPGGACDITLGNGGVADFGNLSRKEFFSGPYAITRKIPLTINCQHRTKVGVDVIDNRKGTASEARWEVFGLGNRAIGYYDVINFGPSQVDGVAGVPIWRVKGETAWREKGIFDTWGSNKTISWDVSGPQSEPVAFKTLTDTLTIWPMLMKSSAFTDEFELDGSATLELVYL